MCLWGESTASYMKGILRKPVELNFNGSEEIVICLVQSPILSGSTSVTEVVSKYTRLLSTH